MRLAALRPKRAAGSKFLTCPAIRLGSLSVENPLISEMPDSPFANLFQNSAGSFPRGLTSPIPVTTTLCCEDLRVK